VLAETAARILAELGPWLWMIFGFGLMVAEIFSGRGFALCLALGAMAAGTIAVLGASGIWPETSGLTQVLVLAGTTMSTFVGLKPREKLI
jgi:membrane protein implicated in regulation of membrane protease activity